MSVTISLTDSPPMPPEDADLVFEIDFRRGEGDPRRIFDAASELIAAFQKLDRAVIGSVSGSIEPALLLEDIEAASLKVYLRNVLNSLDDDALKTLDWKKQVGKYLIEAKYAALRWLDDGQSGRMGLFKLRDDLRGIAERSDVLRFPAYAPIHEARLISALDDLQSAKRTLGTNDRLTIEAHGKVYEVNLKSTWLPSEAIKIEDATRETASYGEMILSVRKPDFMKDTPWLFSHGNHNLTARVFDEEWLKRFRAREVPILPGDALRCFVRFDFTYDESGTLLDQKISIERVLEVLKAPIQDRLL
jgi:hypothetical protein